MGISVDMQGNIKNQIGLKCRKFELSGLLNLLRDYGKFFIFRNYL